MTRIALISDIHFGKLSRTTDFAVPGEALVSEEKGGKSLKEELIAKFIDEKVEYIVVAGDLTSMGSPNEFIHCKEAILEIAEKSNVDYNKIIICLGNHDIDWKISGLASEYSNINTDLECNVRETYLHAAGSVAAHLLGDTSKYSIPGPAPYSGVKEYDDLIFISLNSGWLCSKDDSIKQGRLDDTQLQWLEKTLDNLKSVEKWKILVLHHHPFSYQYPLPSSDHSVLKEGPELNSIIGKYGVNIVCHGHRHHPRVNNKLETGWKNPITFISSGSLSVNIDHRGADIPNLFHVLELSENYSFYLRSYRFRPLEGWMEIRENNDYTPIDFEMFFKEPICKDIIDKTIEDVCSFQTGEAHKELNVWKELPESLKSMSIKELNKSIMEHCERQNIKIYGQYPQGKVALIKA